MSQTVSAIVDAISAWPSLDIGKIHKVTWHPRAFNDLFIAGAESKQCAITLFKEDIVPIIDEIEHHRTGRISDNFTLVVRQYQKSKRTALSQISKNVFQEDVVDDGSLLSFVKGLDKKPRSRKPTIIKPEKNMMRSVLDEAGERSLVLPVSIPNDASTGIGERAKKSIHAYSRSYFTTPKDD
ncbi:unnamed protein product [Clonostachys solani]|uniref:Uncharacterized protein n=1 Tax=Clonostachys solani TaxID=160281 RepID=A0A9P0EHY6_9HYPO|nr:unnamed protein product [Clonostachys solani]